MFMTLHKDLLPEPPFPESEEDKTKRIFSRVKFKTERNILDENKWLSHPLIHGEIELKLAFIGRARNSLTLYDYAILSYLFILSRRRFFVRGDDHSFAEMMNEDRRKITKTINKLARLNYVRRLIHKDTPGFIVNPDLINNGNSQKQAFKIKLWKDSFTPPVKQEKRESCYPLKRKKRKDSSIQEVAS